MQVMPRNPDQVTLPLHRRRSVRIAAASILGLCLLCLATFIFYYIKLAHIIDQRLASGPFAGTTNIFSASHRIAVGDPLTPEEFTAHLMRSGYTNTPNNPEGWFILRKNTVELTSASGSLVLQFSKGKVAAISAPGRAALTEFELGPELIANLSGNRERRHLVKFADIPPSVVHALVSVEDKRFFDHSGIDLRRCLKAAYVDLRSGHKDQGASTLSMQLARSFWLEPDKHWKRKLEELLMTLHMERKLTKQQILEYYVNQVYLGRRDTFSISGFAEGARAYFNKNLSEIDTSEAAFLAGLVQRPSYYNPYRYPERARDRRDVVLLLMHRNRYLADADYQTALKAPLRFTPEHLNTHQNQYFVDLVRDDLRSHLDESDREGRNIFTTLDPNLQEAAEAAVRIGIEKVDRLLHARGQPQIALVALDPHTGEVKALVGGRDYGQSQLNHALSMRQPGSVFKPFVYAAALDTAVAGGNEIFTPASMISDQPATFYSGGQLYQPGNFHHEFMGDVTLRDALAHSLNVATVSLASQVGLRKVVQMAQRSGLNSAIRATPSVALGAYETTPLEIAGAYTTFANQGVNVKPIAVSYVTTSDGRTTYRNSSESHAALDPRVNYLLVNMLQDVLRMGTGAGVRELGFTLPAAGKTGTSRDGWFAGFTSQLLCVVWVGFDDNRELNLEGARSALPVWAEFMKRAAAFKPYHDAKAFAAPSGIVTLPVCAESGQMAGPFCPRTRSDVFIEGTQPQNQCPLHDPRTAEDPTPVIH
jgi:penicillin-binding protein 1B